MSTVFYTSDLHIGHVKIARIRAEVFAPELTFVSDDEVVAWHDNELARKWDAVVADSDNVWVLGDTSSGSSTSEEKALEWVGKRPGVKRLISGNHDKVHPSNRDFFKRFAAFIEVFESVSPFARRKINGVDVLLSHFPYTGDHTDVDRMTQYRLRDEGMPLLHGHTHSDSVGDSRIIHVGVDARGMAPVPTSVIVDQLNGII